MNVLMGMCDCHESSMYIVNITETGGKVWRDREQESKGAREQGRGSIDGESADNCSAADNTTADDMIASYGTGIVDYIQLAGLYP